MNEHIGISRGGKNTKIHASVDALGYPLHVMLSGGNVHDSTIATELLEYTPVNKSIIMADKAYRGKNIRIKIEDIGCTHCIPSQNCNTLRKIGCAFLGFCAPGVRFDLA